MRVTESMMASGSLRHLQNSYQSLIKHQDQLATGKKITRASQDPVIAMNGMRYRTQVAETDQFKRNLSEVYNWMDTSDATLDQGTQALHRVRELTVQASNDTYDPGQRANIAKEIDQLLEQLLSIANTKNNNKYIFNGTNTTNAPVDVSNMDRQVNQLDDFDEEDIEVIFRGATYHAIDFDDLPDKPATGIDPGDPGDFRFFQNTDPTRADQIIAIEVDEDAKENDRIRQFALSRNENGDLINDDGERVNDPEDAAEETPRRIRDSQAVISLKEAVSTNEEDVKIEILKGVELPVNVDPKNVFTNELFGDMIALRDALEDPATPTGDLAEMLDVVDHHIDNFVNERADLGARVNRVEMVDQRVQQQQVIAQRIMSDNEDADMERVITEMLSQENVHRAALSATGRIIQPTLMDFLR